MLIISIQINQSKMSKRRRTLISAAESARNVQAFLDSLDNQSFLDNDFIADNEDVDEVSSIDQDEDEDEFVDDVDDAPPDNSNDPDESAPRPNKYKFKNLDAVVDPKNYDPLPEQPYEEFRYQDSRKKFVMNFSTEKKEPAGRNSARNVLKKRPGPSLDARKVETPLEAWNLFLPPDILDRVVEYTNDNIFEFQQRFAAVLDPSNENAKKYTHCKETDLMELHAFFGLTYLRGVLKLNVLSRVTIWYHESTHDIFAATMSEKRFQFLCGMIAFDDKTTRTDRWKFDKFTAFREFFEAVNQNNGKMRNPSFYLAIDETLYPYRGRIGMKQYNPRKPAKYGLLYRSLCDAEVPYTYFTLPYGGKPDEENEEYGKYHVTGTDNYTKYLVEEFSKINSLEGCNISMDRYFTSVPLARWATENKFTIVGTMRLDRKGVPKQFKDMENREEKSTLYIHGQDEGDENIMLVSYIDKKSSGMKNVVALTTMHKDVLVTKDSIKKPDVLKFYDHTKGGVDVVDLISSNSSTRMKTRKWTLNALAFVLDTERTNAFTIFKEATGNDRMTTFEFTWQLAKNLVVPNIVRRYHNRCGISTDVVSKMAKVLGINTVRDPQLQGEESTQGRCAVCIKSAQEEGVYRTTYLNLNHRLKVKCAKCNQFICKKHQNTVAMCPDYPNC